MAVPPFKELMRPVLEAYALQRAPAKVIDLGPAIGDKLGLTRADMDYTLSSGGQTRFSNRLHWAKFYMTQAGLLSSTSRGYFVITERGRQLLAESSGPIDTNVLSRFEDFVRWRSTYKGPQNFITGADEPDGTGSTSASREQHADVGEKATPEEAISLAVAEVDAALRAELLARIHAEPPAFFERFIRDLLLAMKYGGGIKERGFLTGGSGDGGIDGIIHEDALGLDAVYLQAKRYQPGANISAQEIRGFVGAMQGEDASKGVFVTTSGFTKDATAFIDRVPQRIALIDGDRLAELALRHGVGVRAQRTIVLQRIDEDYFAGED